MVIVTRQEFYQCLTARADELFEPAEAVICTDRPVEALVEPALAPSIGVGTAPCATDSTMAVSRSAASAGH